MKIIIRNVLTASFGLATLSTFFWSNEDILLFSSNLNFIRFLIMIIFLVLLFWTFKSVPKKDPPIGGLKYQKWISQLIWILPALAIIFAVINTLFPELGKALVKGNEIIPFRPAIFVKMAFQLVACGIFAILAKQMFTRKQWLLFGVFGLFVIVTFWMAMEEISWGQRIFRWETTGYFAENNMQGEMNLHNLNTQLFQNVLYFGGFLLLVALPFFRDYITKLLKRIKFLSPLISILPGAWMIGAFAMAIGFTDPHISEAGWHWSSILFEILATGAILSVYAWRLSQLKDPCAGKIWRTLIAFLLILTTSLFWPEMWILDEGGAPTEYLELFIAFGIMCWAIDLRMRLKTTTKA